MCTTLFCRSAKSEKFSSVNLIQSIVSMILHWMKNRLKTEGRPKYVQYFRWF